MPVCCPVSVGSSRVSLARRAEPPTLYKVRMRASTRRGTHNGDETAASVDHSLTALNQSEPDAHLSGRIDIQHSTLQSASRFTCRKSLTGNSVLTVHTLAMVDARATEVHDQAHVRPRWATHRQQQKPGAKGLSYK